MNSGMFDLRIDKNKEWSRWRRSRVFLSSAFLLQEVISSDLLLVWDLLLCRSRIALKVVFSVHNFGLKVA